MYVSSVLVSLAAGLAGIASPAAAPPARQQVTFSTYWQIADPVALPGQPVADAGGAIRVAKGDLFMTSQVVPEGAATLTEAMQTEKGELILPNGAELFALRANVPTYCNTGQSAGSGFEGFLFGGRLYGHVCLVDLNSDGKFDNWFQYRTQIKGLSNFSGTLDFDATTTIDLDYAELPVGQMQARYFVGLQYLSNKNLFKNEIFAIVFGTQDNFGAMSERLSLSARRLTAGQTTLGGTFALVARSEDGLAVRVDTPFAKAPFAVERRSEPNIYLLGGG